MLLSENFLAYLPQDRRQTIATGNELPPQAEGAALCADLSGFTPLTETLASKLGARHGAEELALHLNRLYDALIAPVETYGGSVVGFSGDAITCWFDADDGRRAIAAAQAMQAAMKAFVSLQLSTGETISLGIKAAISSGPVRRLRVGDPAIQYMDTLAGAIMDRLAILGHLAGTGELLLDEHTEAQLHEMLKISEWRTSAETGQRAAVLSRLDTSLEPPPSALGLPDLSEEQVRPWLLAAVFARLQGGQGEFLTELRPAVALFMRFEGLDYEGDDRVGDKLDAVIRQVQSTLVEYDGTLLQLTIGDKGSYLYAAFGAPVAHENDAVRAVAAALELSLLPTKVKNIHSVSIGLSRGVMRTGAYGGTSRRTYGVLGDEVNLAARLMERAAPGQILASEAVWQATPDFRWQALPALAVKGKRTSVAPAALLGKREQEILHLPQATTTLPMVGRQAELALVEEKLELARQGQGQIVSITGEAGMGKSRLLAEMLQRAGPDGLTRFGGECQSYGTHSSYLVWQPVWRAFFGIDPAHSPAEQIETVEKALARLNPDLLPRLPLLGAALNLSIPENELTDGLDARSRKISREAVLVECVRARAREHPIVFILEDVHWIDPLSRDLLELIGRVIGELPVLILLAYRPPVDVEAVNFLPGLAGLTYVSEVHLAELTQTETELLIADRLAHFGLEGTTPPALVERLRARAQANPFYTGELLNYLHDRGLDPRHEAVWDQADLPDSLHSLILSRIDQLSERQQITIKVASIIGRLFRVAWLYGYYPLLGSPSQVSTDLEILSHLELITQETPEPQLAYLFKHVITQEVAYESQAYATRANLHEQFARYLELAAGDDVGPYLDLLAYHYEHSENLARKREYLRRAGEAAKQDYANEAALSYLGRALALAPETDYAERFELLSKRAVVYELLGKREAQYEDITTLLALAEALDDNGRRAWAALNLSSYAKLTSDFPAAIAAAQQAVERASLAGKDREKTIGYIIWGEALLFQANYVEARMRTEQALALAQTAKFTDLTANSLNSLAGLDHFEGNDDNAQTKLERALQLWREVGMKRNEPIILNNLGELNFYRDLAKAQDYYEQAVVSSRALEDRQLEGLALGRLGQLIAEQRGDYAKARFYCEQASHLLQEARDRQGEIFNLCSLSLIDLAQNNYLAARIHAEQGLTISREIGDRNNEAECLGSLGIIVYELGEYASALEYHNQGLSIAREINVPDLLIRGLTASGVVYYALGKHEITMEHSREALSIAKAIKNKLAQTRVLTLQGHALRELGDLDQAVESYQQSLNLALELGLHNHFTKPAQAGLACIALAQGNLAEAQAPMDGILNYLGTNSLSTADEISWIYLVCYRILQANADPRARGTLNAAHNLLQEIAAKIDDEALRASFLQNVRFNREVVQTWENLSSS